VVSHETLLLSNEKIGTIYLAKNPQLCWGDDWNDAPACCNSGEPYPERGKPIYKIDIILGKPLVIEEFK